MPPATFTGPNTEDTPVIVEATAFKRGIVIAQVNELSEALPGRYPGDWVDFVIVSPTPHYIEPLFTRDPAQISEIQVLMAMMAIKGIYAEYEVNRQPRHRLRYRGDRAAAADLCANPRAQGRDLPALGAQPASGADPGDRGRLRGDRSIPSARNSAWRLHPRPARRLLHRRRQPASNRALPGRRTLRLRHVHRLDAPDRPGRQQFDGDIGRIAGSRRPEHGGGCAGPPTPARRG